MRLQYGTCFFLIFLAISHAKLLSTQNLVNIFEMIAAVKVPEAFLTAPEIIELHGYPVETHRIVTEDGYILTLHRIPGSRLSPPRPGKKPVLLQHGVLSCSVDWIITPSGLGYLLADAGYDVWMGNSRGNTYSSSHVELSLEDPEFWQFSWHEMGIYDLPATIDYVLEQTAQRKLYYIGHSMGNTMFYVLCSMRPEYNAKIRAQFSLAPVAFVEHIYSHYQMVALFSLNMNWLYNALSWNNILPRSQMWRDTVLLLCSEASWSQDVCANIILTVFGGEKTSVDPKMLTTIYAHFPAGTSRQTFLHYAQGVLSGKFRQFNYGFQRNLRIYGQFTPPDYDLGKVTAPITLIYSSGDKLADLQDVEQLIDRLPNVYDTIFIDDPQFQHMDFMTNPDVDTVIYDEIISSMRTNDVMMDLGFSDSDMAFNFNDLEKIDTEYDDEGIVILEEHIFAQNKKIIIFKSVDSGNDCDWNSGNDDREDESSDDSHDDINKESDDISYSNNCNSDSKVPSNVKVVILKESVVKFQKKVIFLNREGELTNDKDGEYSGSIHESIDISMEFDKSTNDNESYINDSRNDLPSKEDQSDSKRDWITELQTNVPLFTKNISNISTSRIELHNLTTTELSIDKIVLNTTESPIILNENINSSTLQPSTKEITTSSTLDGSIATGITLNSTLPIVILDKNYAPNSTQQPVTTQIATNSTLNSSIARGGTLNSTIPTVIFNENTQSSSDQTGIKRLFNETVVSPKKHTTGLTTISIGINSNSTEINNSFDETVSTSTVVNIVLFTQNENSTSQNQNISSFTDNTSNNSDRISASKYVVTESSPPGNRSDDIGTSSSSNNIVTSLMKPLTVLLISLILV